MNRPLISMIVGMYKGEKYIRECIDSVIRQDYTNLEIILVDDGSPDNCGSIADTYAESDSRIVVVHQKNAGVSASRNRALDMAKGDYICIIDQDDVLSTDYVSYFYNLIIGNNAQIALTPTAEKFFGSPTFQTEFKDHVEVWSGEQTAIEMLYHKIIIAPWNKMISRKLLDLTRTSSVERALHFQYRAINTQNGLRSGTSLYTIIVSAILKAEHQNSVNPQFTAALMHSNT